MTTLIQALRFPFWRSKRSDRPSIQPLPEKIVALLFEARWLLLAAFTIFLILALGGYHRDDPGWSHSAAGARVINPGGRFGAWLADVLLYLFGLSAWWWAGLFAIFIIWGYKRLHSAFAAERRPFLIAMSGFFLVLGASCALESVRFYRLSATLPFAAGGVVGQEFGALVTALLGFTGGTLILLACFAAGVTVLFGLSWIGLVEGVGGLLEDGWSWVTNMLRDRRDRASGREKAMAREAHMQGKVDPSVADQREMVPVAGEAPAPAVKPLRQRAKERLKPLMREVVEGPLPPLNLLDEPKRDVEPPSAETLELTSRLIERKLADFGVEVKVLAAYPGPVITRYEVEPAVGVKGNQVVNLVKDLARALSVVSIRVVETIPGKSCMGLEIPNPHRQTVRLSEVLSAKVYQESQSTLTLAMGKDIGGQPVVADLARMPHVLVAGTTGSGKSVAINAMILSLLYKAEPEEVRVIMVDPKMLELSVYEGIPHLLAPVVTDMKHAANALNWCVGEMERRYKLMSALGVRNLAGYNVKVGEALAAGNPIGNPFSLTPEAPEPLQKLPCIVVVIDELADLMMVVGKKIEELIARLAQKARAAGIHLVLATQRPSVDVITGLIKANIPTRVAFQVSSKVDSRTILDQMGAESLLGQGDMLYLAPGTGLPRRVHGAFVADDEVHRVVEFLKTTGAPDYVDGILSGGGVGDEGGDFGLDGDRADETDPLYDQAVEVVLKTRRPSISLVQRHLRIGYNRAARLIEDMERAGLVSPMGSNGNREVLVPPREE